MCDVVRTPMPGSAISGVSQGAGSDSIVKITAKRGEVLFFALQSAARVDLSKDTDGVPAWFSFPVTPEAVFGFELSEDVNSVNIVFTAATQRYSIWSRRNVPPLRDLGFMDEFRCLVEKYGLK